MIRREHVEQRLPDDFKPGPTTVVCGQGKASPRFPGNKRLREMVSDRVDAYSSARKKNERSAIVSCILSRMQENDPAPQFALYKPEPGMWQITSSREKS
jgi:hypothetical protein